MEKKVRQKNKSLFFVLVYFILTLCAFAYALCGLGFAHAEKISKLMPRDTELLSEKEDKSQFALITSYKFGSSYAKEKILDFYRRLFKNEGFTEIKGYSPEKKPAGNPEVYFFTKPNNLAMLSLVPQLEADGRAVYYVTLHAPNVEAIKNLDTQKKEYENESIPKQRVK